jgi:hypothetical protein
VSSRKLILFFIAVFVLLSPCFVGVVSADSLVWYNLYGDGWGTEAGSNARESGHSLIDTSDGGYAIAGQTDEFGAGGVDFWLVKTDAYGNVTWNQTYGGPQNDVAESLVETSDGGYAIAGTTHSFGEENSFGVLWENFWLVKTDSYGNMEWNKTYGGLSREFAYSLVATSDGGYAMAGHRDGDCWLVKTDAYGNMEWNKTYAEPYGDYGYSLVATSDGGYAIAGQKSYKTNVTETFSLWHTVFWLAKTDEFGNIEWDQTYGKSYETIVMPENITTESFYNVAYSLIATSDGGYALAGHTDQLTRVIWLVKTDASGNMEWNKTYARAGEDNVKNVAYSVIETFDGGYALTGYTQAEHWSDIYLVKVDEFGDVEWSRTWSGVEDEAARSLIQTSDGGYALTGKMHNYLCFIKTDEYGVVPEYSSWLLPTLLLTATLVIVIYKKKLLKPRS